MRLAHYQNNKAQGPGTKLGDGDICIEILKYAKVAKEQEGGEADFRVKLAKWFSVGLIEEKGEVEEFLSLGRGIMIPKIVGTRKMEKFRGITVLNTLRRLLSIIIMKRLDDYFEKHKAYMNGQYGFRKEKSVLQPCHILQHLQWLAATRKEEVYLMFLDISKAYDNVRWELLWIVLDHYGVPKGLIKYLKSIYMNGQIQLSFNGNKGEWFNTNVGLPQGDPLSPLLFAVYMSFLFRDYMEVIDSETKEEIDRLKGTRHTNAKGVEQEQIFQEENIQLEAVIGEDFMPDSFQEYEILQEEDSLKLNAKAKHIVVKSIMYADDTVGISASARGAASKGAKYKKAAKLGGLEIHPDKLTWMKFKAWTDMEEDKEQVIMEGKVIKRVFAEKYLGSRFTDHYSWQLNKNILQRVGMAKTRRDVTMKTIIENKHIQTKMKMEFYQSDIKSLLFHGVEFWSWNTRNINYLNLFQRETMLHIIGRNYRDRIPDIDIYEWMQKQKIDIYPVQYMMAERKLRYFGNIHRSSEDDIARQIMWSDMKKCTSKAVDSVRRYAHIRDIQEAMKLLEITTTEANTKVVEKKEWRIFLKTQRQQAVKLYLTSAREKYDENRRAKTVRGDYEKEIEEEKRTNGGWYYKRRGMPATNI